MQRLSSSTSHPPAEALGTHLGQVDVRHDHRVERAGRLSGRIAVVPARVVLVLVVVAVRVLHFAVLGRPGGRVWRDVDQLLAQPRLGRWVAAEIGAHQAEGCRHDGTKYLVGVGMCAEGGGGGRQT